MKAQPTESKAALTSRIRLDQIYRAAAQLFCEKGYDATSMGDIAEAVGITKAGVYHFLSGGGKADLLYAVMNYGMDSLEAEVLIPARAVADAEQRLLTIIRKHAELIAVNSGPDGHSPVTIMVDEVAGLNKTQLRQINKRKRVYLELLRTTLETLKEEGKFKEIDTTVAAFSLLGMLLWLSRWFRPDGRLTGEQVAEEICKIALGGFLQPQARLSRKR